MNTETIIKCLKREHAMRCVVYARRVREGKMKPQTAEHEIEAMEAAIACIKEAQEAIATVIKTNNLPDCGIEQAEDWQAKYNPPPAQTELF